MLSLASETIQLHIVNFDVWKVNMKVNNSSNVPLLVQMTQALL